MSAFAEQLAAAFSQQTKLIVDAIRDVKAPAAPALRWLTPDEAEAYCGLPSSFVRRLAKTGVLPWVSFRGMRVDRKALDRLAADRGMATIAPDNATGGGIAGGM